MDYDELLKDPGIDAVHINSPIQDHAKQSIAALRAGNMLPVRLPMATTVEECRQIAKAVEETGAYLYDDGNDGLFREFLFIKENV